MDSSRICHCCCFMNMVSKNFVQPFLRSRKLLCYTQTKIQTKIHKLSLALMTSLFMALTWSELNYYAWCDGTICEQLALACHCPQSFSVDPSAWSSFTEHEFGFSTCANLNIRSFNLNFRYMATSKQADIHMHVRNAAMLVWGSLRLTPMNIQYLGPVLILVRWFIMGGASMHCWFKVAGKSLGGG